MKYRIKKREYAFQDPYMRGVFELSYGFCVQVRKWYGWVTFKEFIDREDSENARGEAEALMEVLKCG